MFGKFEIIFTIPVTTGKERSLRYGCTCVCVSMYVGMHARMRSCDSVVPFPLSTALSEYSSAVSVDSE